MHRGCASGKNRVQLAWVTDAPVSRPAGRTQVPFYQVSTGPRCSGQLGARHPETPLEQELGPGNPQSNSDPNGA